MGYRATNFEDLMPNALAYHRKSFIWLAPGGDWVENV